MQQELADLKKRSDDEADPTQKGKAKETSDAAGSPAF